jgi:hypothetical protein
MASKRWMLPKMMRKRWTSAATMRARAPTPTKKWLLAGAHRYIYIYSNP